MERNLGLEEQDGKLVRVSRPLTILEASRRLAEDSNLDDRTCQSYLAQFLLAAHQARNDHGRSFFAFRLHQFISGAWNAYSTLEAPGDRYLTLDDQQFKPGDRDRPLFPLCFCRACGQEYFPVWARLAGKQPESFSRRELGERSNEEELPYGYFMPDRAGEFDPHDLEGRYPEEWLAYQGGVARLKRHYRRDQPQGVRVNTCGHVAGEGLPGWFIPRSFRFCLNPECSAQYDGNVRPFTKLSGLSSEGRSSATTMLVLSSLKHLIGSDLDDRTKKLLAFTDNRQDASLQAGHFNDFIQVLLLRGALLAALRQAADGCLTNDVLAQQVLTNLHLDAPDYAANPEAKGIRAQDTLGTLRDVLGYRLYFDLKRGWRITNPSLEQLGLLRIRYRDLTDCCQDEEEWNKRHPLLAHATPEQRFKIVSELLDRMRKALCIKTIYLDPIFQDRICNRSFNALKEPWGAIEGGGTIVLPCSHGTASEFSQPQPQPWTRPARPPHPIRIAPIRLWSPLQVSGILGIGQPALSGKIRRGRLQRRHRRHPSRTDGARLRGTHGAGWQPYGVPHRQFGSRMAAGRRRKRTCTKSRQPVLPHALRKRSETPARS